MDKLNFIEVVDEIVRADGRYDRDTYFFVREGLDYTLKMLKQETKRGPRHVTGQELLNGLRQHALEEFGPMAKTVLEHWGVRRCEDFGEIVFRMVDKGILGKTEQDRPEDFQGGYDFDEAFVRPFQPAPGSGLPRTTASRPNRRRLPKPEKLSGGTN